MIRERERERERGGGGGGVERYGERVGELYTCTIRGKRDIRRQKGFLRKHFS